MEVAIRKKRPVSSGTTGLPSHTNAGLASAYGSSSGLASSTTRRGLTGAFRSSTLSFYNDAPQDEITLDQFERAGVDRLQALKSMESIRVKKSGALNNKNAVANDPAADPFSQVLAKFNLEHPQWDNLSHFVLRLAYCKTEELRRWMITQESLLFKYRFDSEKEENVSAFLKENDLKYQPLDDDEMNSVIPSETDDDRLGKVLLRDLLRQVPYADSNQTIYYKVPFEDAIDLLRERKVYLQDGFAYVSRTNLSAIITTKFRTRLSQHLSMTCRATNQIKQDGRITPLLSMLGKQYITPNYQMSKIEGAVTKEQIPALAERSMPLCMSNLYGALKSENHLKHFGRMQFGLFLKGIGLSLADALVFWKTSFARRTPPEKFDKEYAYNIRHNYGKEGKRTTYTPYGCSKIINTMPAPGDHHGCPFRTFGEPSLRTKMKSKNFTPAQSEEILTLVKGQHFQIACQRWYQFTHNGVVGEVGSHPNAYFDASENYWREQEGLAKDGKAPTPTSASSQPNAAYNAMSPSTASQTTQPAVTPPTSATTPSPAPTATPETTQNTQPATTDAPTPMETETPPPATEQ